MKPTQLECVRYFHQKFGLVINNECSVENLTPELVDLRCTLITEEYKEFLEAVGKRGMIEIADALADLLYVIHGTAVSFGIPLDEVFMEVHYSNLSKLDENGKPIIREDGKILKGPDFRAPDLAPILWPVPNRAW